MLVLNEDKTILEGSLKLSDGEGEFIPRWLAQSGQASFFIGDKEAEKSDIAAFISGKKACYINLPSYLKYLAQVSQIVSKYKSMYYGPVDVLTPIINRFTYLPDSMAKVILSYETGDRYIRILNNKRGYNDNVSAFGDLPLKNGDDLRHSLVGGITEIKIIKKDNGEYEIEIYLIENWRDEIMKENGKKVDLESVAGIFNSEMNQCMSNGYDEIESAKIFGVKYGPLLKANEHKFTASNIVNTSSFDGADIVNAIEEGKKLSPSLVWAANFDDFGKDAEALPTRSPRTNPLYPLNFILYGAPGTGKTYSTAIYAVGIIENKTIEQVKTDYADRSVLMDVYNKYRKAGLIEFVTFHQSYSYEDFIEGLKPLVNEEENAPLKFDYIDGAFKKIADKAMNSDSNHVIILDEINRGNVSRILGVLITLLEEDKRWGEENQLLTTLASGDSFAVPNNLFVVGTMNTADKSISLIDVALRRRFEFIEAPVKPELVDDEALKKILTTINDELLKKYKDTDNLVGHAYFINKTIDDLEKIMNNAIIPLIYEYSFDKVDVVKEIVKKAIEGTDYKLSDSNYGRVKITK